MIKGQMSFDIILRTILELRYIILQRPAVVYGIN